MRTLFKQLVLVATLSAGLGFSSQAWSAPNLTGDLWQDMEITRTQILDPNLHAKLKENLTEEDYQNWSANLKEMGSPIAMSNGMVYYEAFKDSERTVSSGIVLGDNGLFYLMYKHPTTNKLVYVSNDATCNNGAHYMSLPFAKTQNAQGIDKKQANTMQTVSHNCEQIYMSPNQINLRNGRTEQPLTRAEADALRQTAIAIWGNEAKSWTMNRQLADVTNEAVRAIKRCNGNIELVPTPAGVTKPGIGYISKYFKQLISKITGIKSSNKQNYACIQTVAGSTKAKAIETQY